MHEPKAKRVETSHVNEKALGHVSPKLQSLLKNSMMADFGVTNTSTVTSKSVTKQQFTSDSSETKRSNRNVKSELTTVKREDSFKGKSSNTKMKTSEDSKRTRILQESNMINGSAKKSLENAKSKIDSAKTINIKISNDSADKKKKNSVSVKGIVMVVKADRNEKESNKSHRNKVHLNKSESFKSSPKFVQKQESFNANGTKIRVSTTVAKTPSIKTDSLRRKDSGEKSAFKPVAKKNSDSGDKMEKVLAAREKVARKAQTYGKFVQTSERKSHASAESSQLTRSEAFTERKSASSSTGKITSRNSKNALDSLDRRRQSSNSPDGTFIVSSAAAVQRVTKRALESRRQSSESPDKKIISSENVSTRQVTSSNEFRTTENRRRQSSEDRNVSAEQKVKKTDSRVSEDRRPSNSSPERKIMTSTNFRSSEERRSSERKLLSSEAASTQRRTSSDFHSEGRRRLSSGSPDGRNSSASEFISATKKNKSEVSKNHRESSSSPDGKMLTSSSEQTKKSVTDERRRQASETPERTSYVIKSETSSDRRKQQKSVSSSTAQKVVKSDSTSSVTRRRSKDSPERKVASKTSKNDSFTTIDSLGDSTFVSAIVRRLEAPSPFMNKDLLRRSFRRESTLVNSILGSQEENRAFLATGPRDGTVNFSETTLVSPFIMKGAARHSLRSTPTSGSESDSKAQFPDVVSSAVSKGKPKQKEKILKTRHSSDAVVSSKSTKTDVKTTRSTSSNEIISDQKRVSQIKESHTKENAGKLEPSSSRESPEKVTAGTSETRRSSVLSESAQNILKHNAKENISETGFQQSRDFITSEQDALSLQETSEISVHTSRRQSTEKSNAEDSQEKILNASREEKSRVKNIVAEMTDSATKESKTVSSEEKIIHSSARSVSKQTSDQNLKVKSLIQEFSSIEASAGDKSFENDHDLVQNETAAIVTTADVSRSRISDVTAVEDKHKRISAGTVKGLVQERSEMFESKARQSGDDYDHSPVRNDSRRGSVLSESSDDAHVIERHTAWHTSPECPPHERDRSKDGLTKTTRDITKSESEEICQKVSGKHCSSRTSKIRSDRRSKEELNSVRRELFPEETKRPKFDATSEMSKRSSSSHIESKMEESTQSESVVSKRRSKGKPEQESVRRSSNQSNGDYGMIQKRRDSKSVEQRSESSEISKTIQGSTQVSSKTSKRKNEEYVGEKLKVSELEKNQDWMSKQERKKSRKGLKESSDVYGQKNSVNEVSSRVSKTRSKGHSVIQQPPITATTVVQESMRISSGRVSRHRNETVTYSVDRLGDSPEYATLGAAEHREKVREVTERLSKRGDDARRGKEPLRSFEKISNGWVEGNVQDHTRSSRAVVTTSSQSTASQLSAGSKCIAEITKTIS